MPSDWEGYNMDYKEKLKNALEDNNYVAVEFFLMWTAIALTALVVIGVLSFFL